MWSLAQPAGKPDDRDLANSSQLLASPMLLQQFDTLLVMDRLVKHEAAPIAAADESMEATRDVWTFEVRPLRREAEPISSASAEESAPIE